MVYLCHFNFGILYKNRARNVALHTVDGSEILHQLRLVVYPIIYKVLYIPGGCLGFLMLVPLISRLKARTLRP